MTARAGHQIVTFRLGDDLFAADINDVERVLRYAAPTPVPNVPDWVQGVIEYRSRVVPVIDLRARFELPAVATNGATRLMVLSSNGDWIAAVVDAVLEVVAVGSAPLAPPPPLFAGMSADFLKGILRRNDRLIIVLDVTRLLATRDRLAFDRAVLTTLPQPEPEPVAVAEPSAALAALDPAPAGAPAAAPTPAEPANDFTIIRGSLDPAAGGDLSMPGNAAPDDGSDTAPRPGPAVPQTPEWGTSRTARPRPGTTDNEGGGSSDG